MSHANPLMLAVVLPATGSTFAQLCAGWIAILPIAALALYGWIHGVFLAVIAGMQIVASFVIALGLARNTAAFVEAFGCPPAHSLAVAFALVFLGCIVGIRLAVGAAVPEGAVRFSRVADRIGGTVLGGVAGAVLGGAILVGWSLGDVPAFMRFQTGLLPFDGGQRMLWTFSRWATPTVASSRHLVSGDPPAAKDFRGMVVRASEPFVDVNNNGLRDGPASESAISPEERFIDLDGDKAFTSGIEYRDDDRDGLRTTGLFDCYRLGDWRRVRCCHAPRITSAEVVDLPEESPVGFVLYTATATDPDPGDEIKLDFKLDDHHGEPVEVAFDPASGTVSLQQQVDYDEKKQREFSFTLTATDRAGLTDAKQVRVRVIDKLMDD